MVFVILMMTTEDFPYFLVFYSIEKNELKEKSPFSCPNKFLLFLYLIVWPLYILMPQFFISQKFSDRFFIANNINL